VGIQNKLVVELETWIGTVIWEKIKEGKGVTLSGFTRRLVRSVNREGVFEKTRDGHFTWNRPKTWRGLRLAKICQKEKSRYQKWTGRPFDLPAS